MRGNNGKAWGAGGFRSSGGASGSGGYFGDGGWASGGSGNAGSGSGGVANGGSSNGGSGSGGLASGGSGGSATGGSGTGGSGTGGTAAVFVNPPPGSGFFVGANFWNMEWEAADTYFPLDVDFATTTNPWRPEFLADLEPYTVLRFIDWNSINDDPNIQADWNTRVQKTDHQGDPVAFEWQIDLCNRSKTDYWLSVPHQANTTYWRNLATLVRDQLDPTLRIYLEWSNEVWNTAFPQSAYAAGQASNLGLPGNIPSASFYVYQSVRLFEVFEEVFGKENPRLVKVLAGQAAWTGPCDAHRTALASTQINPQGTRPDVYAVAPYLAGVTTAELSALPNVTPWVQSDKTCADSLGVPLVSYEGGSDSYAASNCQAVQQDQAMYGIYQSYLDAVAAAGLVGPFMQYTHSGRCWGLKVRTDDSLAASPKYRAVLDWLAAH